MNFIKSVVRKTPLYGVSRKLYRRMKGIPRHPLQDFKTEQDLNLVYLGTDYGGWTFVDYGDLENCVIISAGLGEDASFDVEFASRYGARVVIVDPTPRAVQHFKEISSNLGQSKSMTYVDAGRQPIEAYDLSGIHSEQLVLIEKALWNESTTLKFFMPPDPEHVSHSIVNFQNNYRNDTSFIEVEAITVDEILDSLALKSGDISLIKLDIEGAEVEVLEYCLSKGIRPRQILVEFDELNSPSDIGFKRVTDVNSKLLDNGYRLVYTDGQADFLYVRN